MTSKEYVSSLSSRYASSEMSYLFSEHHRIVLFRRLWIALAKGEQKIGLPITDRQIKAMEGCCEEIDLEKIREYETRFRHDVMAHIHAFGDLCPEAKPIIHLGATSSFATDNADMIQMKQALELLVQKLTHVLTLMAQLARKYKDLPCVGYTHFQAAQPTTVGKRICLWLQDFLWDAKEWARQLQSLPFLGAKGATGTQNSFLLLCKGNHAKVKKLEEFLCKEFGFKTLLPIAGQTYTRKLDCNVLHALSCFAASAHKMATDLRLLAHEGEMSEGFGKHQVGSSAMPHKRNPIYSERICGIARFVMALSQNGANTLATQWLERSLDDSSNKRLSMPEAFLGADAILGLLSHLLTHLTVSPASCESNLQKHIPHLVMENILMHAAKEGESRQDVHETLRKIALEMPKSKPLDFLLQKAKALHLTPQEAKRLFSLPSLIGRAPEQVSDFLQNEAVPFLRTQKKRKIPRAPTI